jgi:hypothetical protein
MAEQLETASAKTKRIYFIILLLFLFIIRIVIFPLRIERAID